VRYEALRHLPSDGDALELAHQEPAVISYDERLADTERLPTSVEPRDGHFAAFQELLSYVQGALPTALPNAQLTPGEKEKLLDDLEPCYGLFAEQEQSKLLDDYFLRTHHVEDVNSSRVVLILGGKGSGKTALFSYLTEKSGAIAVHGPRFGFGPDLLCALQDTAEQRMDVFWRLYMLSRLPPPLLVSGPLVAESVSLLQRLPVAPSLLGDFQRQLNAAELALQVDHTWKALDKGMEQDRKRLVLCLDGLDAAFKADAKRRERALVSLFTAWQATFATLRCVELKVFLRVDLWERLSFPEKSHFRGKEMKLAWDTQNLWRLVLKRAIAAPEFGHWCEKPIAPVSLTERSVELAGENELYPYLDRLFEHHIWAGKNSLSRNWIRRRLADAKDTIYPRDLLCLFQDAIRTERERLRKGSRTSENAVISRESLSAALPPTSRQRVDAVREEYPELGNVLELLRGLPASGDLKGLTADIAAKAPGGMTADTAIDLLSEASVLRIHEGTYVVPDLYRHGLEMRRFGPK
jgi:hypothetical protein